MSRPPVRDEEGLLGGFSRRIQLLERRLNGGGSGGGGGGDGGTPAFMTPTSVTGGVFDPATGRINITPGTKEIRVHGIFTGDYRAYEITFAEYTGDNHQLRFDLLRNNVRPGATYWQWYNQYQDGGSASVADQWVPIDRISSTGKHGTITVLEPMFTAGDNVQKRVLGATYAYGGSPGLTKFGGSLSNNDTTAFDGFLINTDSLTGTTPTSYSWLIVTPIPTAKGSSGSVSGAGVALPAGTIQPYAGAGLPTGALWCDGSAVSRTTYSALFGAIGTTYGAGDGSTTFNVPNLKGRVAFGLDPAQTEFDTLGETGGAKTHRHDFRFGLFDKNWMAAGSFAAMESASQTNGNDKMGAFRYSTGTYQGATGGTPGVSASNLAYNAAIGASNTTGQLGRMESVGDTATPSGTTGLPPYLVTNWLIWTGQGSGAVPTPPVSGWGKGTTAERNATYPLPTTDAQRVALANSMPVWFNTEKGYEEIYYAVTGLSGLSVRALLAGQPSGWYPKAGSLLTGLRDKSGAFEAAPAAGGEPTLQVFAVNHGGFTTDGNSGLRVPVGGYYEVIGRVYASGAPVTLMSIRITKNSTSATFISQDPLGMTGSNDVSGQTVSGPHALLANDRVGLWVILNVASNYYGAGLRTTYLSVRYLGPPLVNG